MVFKGIRQLAESSMTMVVAHSRARCLPDMLLWIEIRRCRGQIDDFQPWVRCEQLFDRLTSMPGGAIPEHEDRLCGIGLQQAHQKKHSCVGVHKLRAQRCFLARQQVQRPIEVRGLSSRVQAHKRHLAPCMPHNGQGRLQIERGFVSCEDDRLRCILCRIRQFFSISSSNAITAAAERDL